MASGEDEHSRAPYAPVYLLGQPERRKPVSLPMQDERWHPNLAQPVHTIVASRCFKLAPEGIMRLWTPHGELQGEQSARLAYAASSPRQGRRDEDQAADHLGIAQNQGCRDAPSHRGAKNVRLLDT